MIADILLGVGLALCAVALVLFIAMTAENDD